MSLYLERATPIRIARQFPIQQPFSRIGHVYGYFFDEFVKVGSSLRPGMRLRELYCQWYWSHIRSAIVTDASQTYRAKEKALLAILQPWQIGHHRSERFVIPAPMKVALLAAFHSNLDAVALKKLRQFAKAQIV